MAPPWHHVHLNMLVVGLEFVMNNDDGELLLPRDLFYFLTDDGAIFKLLIGLGVHEAFADKFFGVKVPDKDGNLCTLPHGQLWPGCHSAKQN